MTDNKKVISFRAGEVWTFWDFLFPNGSNPIENWYESLSDEGRLLFDALLKNNQKIGLPNNWPRCRFLSGKYKEERIWELQFVADRRQYRVLGTFGSTRKQAVILMGCYHKGPVYTPSDALHQAYQRARALKRREASLYERKIKNCL